MFNNNIIIIIDIISKTELYVQVGDGTTDHGKYIIKNINVNNL